MVSYLFCLSSNILLKDFYFKCMFGCLNVCVYVCVYHMSAWYMQGSEEDLDPLELKS